MKKNIFILWILALIANIQYSPLQAQVQFEEGKVAVVSHRGDWRNAPENSIKAIENCIDMGVDMVEIDIKKSKDDVLILLHDHTLDRATTGKGRPEEYTIDELKKMRLRNGAGIPTAHSIPTLEEAMLTVKGKIWVNIDKGYDYFQLVEKVLEKTGTSKQVMIKAGLPYETVNKENKTIIQNLFFMPIVNANAPDAKKFVEDYITHMHPQAFEVCFQQKTPQVTEVINLITKSGSKVWINTLWPSLCAGLNDDRAVEDGKKEETWGEILKMNASFIQTDRPAELIEYLKDKSRFINKAILIRKKLMNRDQNYVHVVSHRGDWINYPENSIDAINSIIKMGGDVVEIDVQRTKDGILILMHDETLDRTTTGKGVIAETLYKDIQKLRLKDHKGIPTEHKIPTLKEALLFSKGRIMLNLDKSDRFFDQVIELLQETGTVEIAIMKGSQSYDEAKTRFGKYFNQIIYMPMIRMDNENAEKEITEFTHRMSPIAFELGYKSDSNPLPQKAKKIINGKSLIWYNSLEGRNAGHDDVVSQKDPDKGYGYLIDVLGARMIQTDAPEFLINYLKERKLHD